MQWDVFCRVIDNFGDIGVCWRLARDLHSRGHQVRLWVDDASALAWMAPQFTKTEHPGLTVRPWPESIAPNELPEPGDVVIEAFGCNPPDAFVTRMNRRDPPQWLNLEYLSAEDYVERSHGLTSPMWHGPASGLKKRFFYPGFTEKTGGLLREPGTIAALDACSATEADRIATLAALGVEARVGERRAFVFCYDYAPFDVWLERLAADPTPTHLILAQGFPTQAGLNWSKKTAAAHPHIRLTPLKPVSQTDFDRLLACCDLNLVRGEDSAVRALWAGRPHIWQIYAQDDGAHEEKLDAFLKRWTQDWPDHVRQPVQAWWKAWNRLSPWPDTLPTWPQEFGEEWHASQLNSRRRLTMQNDLVTQLLLFVTGSG